MLRSLVGSEMCIRDRVSQCHGEVSQCHGEVSQCHDGEEGTQTAQNETNENAHDRERERLLGELAAANKELELLQHQLQNLEEQERKHLVGNLSGWPGWTIWVAMGLVVIMIAGALAVVILRHIRHQKQRYG
eukprot:TRINITY_DN60738_c0_g1_i1.p2 TRINITY_DN60738_c0_g1~~TRINITY_DN60738_c0_g1_i1.p2  ORF type:complete len:132 (-),score=42.88 TRINITY_DN60738_c0_g1_i1:164-559(-)